MGRPKGTTDVSPEERQHIRKLFLDGVRFTDIANLTGRCESVIHDATRGLHRPRLKRRAGQPAKRNDQILAMVEHGKSRAEIGRRFGLSPTQVNTIVVEHPHIAHLLRVKCLRPSVVARIYRLEVSTARRIAAGPNGPKIPRSWSGEWRWVGYHARRTRT